MSESTKRHRADAPSQLSYAVFAVSTSRFQIWQKTGSAEDVSGDLLESKLREAGHTIALREIIPDSITMIRKAAEKVLDRDDLDAVVFSGGTGVTKTDVTIETIAPLLERTLPGFGEIFRRLSYDKIGSAAVLSRALAGVAKGKAFFCVPGSPDAVRLCLERLILPEAAHVVKHARES